MFTIQTIINRFSVRSASILASSLTIGFLFCCSGGGGGPNIDDPGNGQPLASIAPGEAGYSSEKLATARQFAEESGIAAAMALYDGRVFFPGVI